MAMDNSDMNTRVDKIPSTVVEEIGTDFTYKHKIVWLTLIGHIIFNILGFIGIVLYFTFQVHPLTMIYTAIFSYSGGLAITIGAHRCFTHRAFKATTMLRRILLILFIMIGQNSLWEWVRNHRQHHKYSDTDADPHNARRGLFFSHIGWLFCRRNPKVIQYGKGIDMSDINADSWIMFQKKYYVLLYFTISIFISTIIPIVLWNEDPVKSLLVCSFGRNCLVLHLSCTVNSLAHAFGTKPYDKSLLASQNTFVNFLTGGEGFHNYHHVFPWDYRASEFDMKLKLSTILINWFAKMGWIYDLRTASEELIKKRMMNTTNKQQS